MDLDAAWRMLVAERLDEAARLSQALLDVSPDNVSALACHAMANWKAGGDIEQSLAEVQRAVQLAPSVASLRHNLATLLASHGDSDAATEQFRAALTIKPDDTVAFYGLTQNSKFRDGELVKAMVALCANPAIEPARREFLAYGLTKVFDDLGVPEKAMTYAIEANRLGARPFDMVGEAHAVTELCALAAGDSFRRARRSGHPSRAPLFIVGMPRSGTTLVESILSRHPDVLARGETGDLAAIESDGFRRLGFGPLTGRHQMALPPARLAHRAGRNPPAAGEGGGGARVRGRH